MDKRSFKTSILLIVFLFYTFLYKFLIFPNYMKHSDIITASFFILYLFASIKCLGYRKDKMTILTRNILKVLIFHLLLFFILLYGVGFFVGFLKNSYSRALYSIFDNAFGLLLIIILEEVLRYVIIWANKDKKHYVFLFTLVFIIFECFMGIRSIDYSDWTSVFRATATIILPVIVKNVMLSYLCYHVGYKIPLIYRIVVDLYIFVVPVVPNLGEYVNSMVLISLPLMIYISSLGMVDYHTGKEEPVLNKSNFDLLDIPISIVLIIVVCLISGLFPHFMVGVGSDSMSPVINKGDAVIILKVKDVSSVKKNDIVAYKKGEKLIIHRVVSIDEKNGKSYFTTKGDANGGNDPDIVKESQIRGVVKVKVPYVAYPTVRLNEYLNGR